MKPLLKIMLLMLAIFCAIFLAIRAIGILEVEDVRQWLDQASNLSKAYIAVIVIVLLLVDLFISVPTLALIIMTGYFLGPVYGFIVSLFGLVAAGLIGYVFGMSFGAQLLGRALKNEHERRQMHDAFRQNSFMMIALARALPMLPEVTALLSGVTRLPLAKFLLAWLAGNIPYVLIASYLGSISSPQNPTPAIWGALGLAAFLWVCWITLARRPKT